MGKRGYNDGCALSHGLELVGERWALLVVRELFLGPKRFTDLQSDLPGVSADVLSQRLKELQGAGLVRRRRLGPPAPAWVYELTAWGAQLEPLTIALARWASQSPALQVDAPISASSLILSLKALFDPDAAGDLEASVTLRVGEEEFAIRVVDGAFTVGRGAGERTGVTLSADTRTLNALLYDGLEFAEAQRTGRLAVTGDADLARRFLALFPLPEPVAAA